MKLTLLMKAYVTALCLLAIVTTKAQNASIANLAKQVSTTISDFHDKYPQEKVFLQTDRTVYAQGETIWMKGWVTLDGKPTYLSRILYIDLVDESGTVLDKKMYKLDSLSSTAADFLVSNTIPTGNYQIRAYTLWMLNFKDYIFRTNVYISGKSAAGPTNKNKTSIGLHFFPEGGDLVNGLESVVGFKAYDHTGNSVAVKGSLTDNTGTVVTSLQTDHDGMGSFIFTPVSGKVYTANLVTQDGKAVKQALPLAKEEGVVLKVSNASPTRLFVMTHKNTKLKETYNKLLLIAQMHNTIVYQGEINFEEGATAASISKKNLPPGIMQITLFDGEGKPLAERLTFIKNIVEVAPQVGNTQISFQPKNKESLSIQLAGARQPNVSVCITDATTDNVSNPEGIVASLLLTSDLKGRINNPNYYFKNNDSTTNRHLDLLLMTQGWRRFVWNDILANKMPALQFPVESGIAIKGKVTKPGSQSLVMEGTVSLVIKAEDSTTLLSEAAITDKGEFIVDNLAIKKSASVSYQGTNSKKQNLPVDVTLYPGYIDTLKKVSATLIHSDYSSLAASKSLNSYLAQRVDFLDSLNGKEYLSNVTVRAKRLAPADSLNKEYATGLFEFGGRRLDPENKAYFSIWQYIKAVPGFAIEGDMKNPNVSLTRNTGINVFSDNSTSASQSATFADAEGNSSTATAAEYVENGIAFFLNEVPVSRDVLDNLTFSDISLIKTYVGAESSIIGPYSGVIAVYTKKGIGVGKSILDKAFAKTRINGYAVSREFFSPNYELNVDASVYGDNRITLFWKPTVNFDAKNSSLIQFYNNDAAKKIKVVVQGMDADGRFIYKEQIIE